MITNTFRNLYLMIGGTCLFMACSTKSMTEDALKDYINNEEHGLHKHVVKNNDDIEVFYRPASLVWKRDLEALDKDKREQAQKGYDTLSYFVFHFSRNGKEIENSFVSNPTQFSAIISYLSFEISNNMFLVQKGDTTRALDAIYTRTFGAAGSTSVMAVFPKKIKENNADLKVCLDDTMLGVGACDFTFNIRDINNTPTLKF